MVSSPMTQFSPGERDGGALVTVIVPVFNTRPQLIERAVMSVLDQTHTSLELLIVNDGSSAEIAQFLDVVAERDTRIRIVHRQNGGVSAARNSGLEFARGDFVAYLDADDYLEPHFLSASVRMAETTQADVVFGGIRVLHEGSRVEWRTGGPSATDPLLSTEDMIVSACVRALSDSPTPHQPTELLSVTNVVSSLHRADSVRHQRFQEGLSHAEDRLYNVSLLLGATRVAFCSDVWYVYDQTDDQGVTRRATSRTTTALSRTIREFAAVGSLLSGRPELSADARDRITQAAADGVLNYLKVLTGVMAVVRPDRGNGPILRSLLKEPSVRTAVARAKPVTWRDKIFVAAALSRQIGVLSVLGRLWVRSGGLGMSANGTAVQGAVKQP